MVSLARSWPDSGHGSAATAGLRAGWSLRAALFGVLLALALTALPRLRLAASGLDRLILGDWLVIVLPLVAGMSLGRCGRRSQQNLFVAAIALAVVAAFVALALALRLAQAGDPALLGALAAAYGAGLGALAPRALGVGVLAWVTPAIAASSAAITVAALTFAAVDGRAPALQMTLVLVPVVALFAVAGAVNPPPPFGTSPWPRWRGLTVLAIALGSLGGAAQHALVAAVPPLVPALFCAGLAGCALAVLARSRRGTLAFAALTPIVFAFAIETPARIDRTILAQSGAAVAIYQRSDQELQLWCDGVLIAGEGPDRPQSPFVATLLAGMRRGSDRVLVLGDGIGRLPAALAQAGFGLVDVASWRTAARPLLPRLANDGPIADPTRAAAECGPGPRGCRERLAQLPDASRQAIVMAEPLHAASRDPLDVAVQRQLRRVVGAGVVLQPFAMDRVEPARLRRLFAAVSGAHPWNGVFAIGDCAVLVSAAAPPQWSRAGPFGAWHDDARWQGHRAHCGSVADLQRSWLGTLAAEIPAAAADDDDGPGRKATLAVLHRSLVSPPPIAADARSQLLWWTGAHARRRATEREIFAAPGTDRGRALVRSLSPALLPLGSPSAALQAALGIADAHDVSFKFPDAAVLAAHAIDPTFFVHPPPVLVDLPRPKRSSSELEDLARLPGSARLGELCRGEGAFAIALRTRFGSRCARALVEALARGPLDPPAQQALRELADPFVLAEAGRILDARGRRPELLALWRGDLPLPRALEAMLRGPVAERLTLANALAGRRDGGSLSALADLLTDGARSVRAAAGSALATTSGGKVTYDAEWPASRRFLAAQQVRAMHNRRP